MRIAYPGYYSSLKSIGGHVSIPVQVLAIKETRIQYHPGQPATTICEVELLFPDGRTGWYNEDVLI